MIKKKLQKNLFNYKMVKHQYNLFNLSWLMLLLFNEIQRIEDQYCIKCGTIS